MEDASVAGRERAAGTQGPGGFQGGAGTHRTCINVLILAQAISPGPSPEARVVAPEVPVIGSAVPMRAQQGFCLSFRAGAVSGELRCTSSSL